jgi:polar amino acid transport system substrate-binding protein
VVVGTSADYPPFEFVDEAGITTGFDVELMNEIGKRMGVTVEWTDMPFDSLIAAVQEGKIDMSIAAFNYDENGIKQSIFLIHITPRKTPSLCSRDSPVI